MKRYIFRIIWFISIIVCAFLIGESFFMESVPIGWAIISMCTVVVTWGLAWLEWKGKLKW